MSTEPVLENLAQLLKNFAEKDAVKAYMRRLESPNFWSIMGQNKKSYETYYSKILRWLLDPTENHGLGNLFALELLAVAGITEKASEVSRSAGRCGAETEALGKNIDVFYYDEANSTTITLEVKMGSSDHLGGSTARSQLDKYYDAVENHATYGASAYSHRYYLYLTIDGSEPTIKADSSQYWQNVSYENVAEACSRALIEVSNEGAVKIIRDFIFDLRRHRDLASGALELASEEFLQNTDELALLRSLASYLAEDEKSDECLAQQFEKLAALCFTHGIYSNSLEKYIFAINEALPEYRQEHTPRAEAQELIEKISESLTGTVLSPNSMANIKDDWRYRESLVKLRRTRGKGQGLNWVDSQGQHHLYISAGHYGGALVLPQDPSKLQREIFSVKFPSRKDQTVAYWLEHFDELEEMLRQWLRAEASFHNPVTEK